MLRRIVSGVTLGAAVCAIGALTDGCLTRPVEATSPVTKTNFITSIPQGSIDKVDILFDIDNSASMGDKQAYLSDAVPDLLTRLITPNCIDDNDPTGTKITGQSSTDGKCAAGSTAEFPPVHNLHIGIVSSSLGGRLGNQCLTAAQNPTAGVQKLADGSTIDRHNDDQAHLLDRSADPTNLMNYHEGTLAAADPGAFLDWFPNVMANQGVMSTGPTPIMDPTALKQDFQKLVVGVHQFGCGIESQLETWYRFLIQPDPYLSLTTTISKITGKPIAEWVGVDTTLLAQRAEFLRPDSLVAVIVLTDENDSEVDVRSFGGSGFHFMDSQFPPPRGTSACAQTPGDSACTSCAFGKNGSDPECMKTGGVYPKNPVSSNIPSNDWGYDLNLRHVHEKQKYGADVQFPIQRYVLGLTSKLVPNRDGEYPPDPKNPGVYASVYAGGVNGGTDNLNCTSPLFAAALPTPPAGTQPQDWKPDPQKDLCQLPLGTRSQGLIYYAHIGGVPHELLQVDPTKTDEASQSQKDKLSSTDWQRILGKDPLNYKYDGIDPHMIESYQSRIPIASGGFPLSSDAANHGDPIAGYEWVTDSLMPQHQGLIVDREYACIFKLKMPRDCSDTATAADPTLLDSCDCQPPKGSTTAAPVKFSPTQLPPVCNQTTQTQQDYAKAYPTIRELLLAKLLGDVGPPVNEGIISSLCPIHINDEKGGNDPLYGYRPAINVIVNRLKNSLSHQCLPQRLNVEQNVDDGKGGKTDQVSCLVLGTFAGLDATADCPMGYSKADPTVLDHFRKDQNAAWKLKGSKGTDPSTTLTCQLNQLKANVPCDNNNNPDTGWCYVEGAMSKGCPQEILFTPDALKGGVVTTLQCIEASVNILDGSVTTVTTPSNDDSGAAGD